MLCLLRRPIPIVNVEGVAVITQSAGLVHVMVYVSGLGVTFVTVLRTCHVPFKFAIVM